ncbi:SRPBCC family protein [Streptomyces sp. NPDC057877]|uniref:SRPBCC family protein n=1 Tax=Streptomyces sp. NPDC057877 TaxID=3346269 RepID=UPI0036BBD5F3
MSGERVGTVTHQARVVTHQARVAAPAGVVYAVLADAATMPLYFPPSIHVERLHFDGAQERLRVWTLNDGQLTAWTAWRHLDPVERRITFRQDLPSSPPSQLHGQVSLRDEGARGTVLEMRYGLTGAAGLPNCPPSAHQAASGDPCSRLTGLKSFAEHWTRLDDLVLSFEDSIRINGPAELAYDLLYRAADWPGHIPHITRADLDEDTPGVQRLTLHTLTEDGPATTTSVRLCFPHAGRIVFKQTTPWAPLAAHTGEWSIIPDENGVTVTCQQSVVLREDPLTAAPGTTTHLAFARRRVRTLLGRHSQALLTLAKQHAESAVRML